MHFYNKVRDSLCVSGSRRPHLQPKMHLHFDCCICSQKWGLYTRHHSTHTNTKRLFIVFRRSYSGRIEPFSEKRTRSWPAVSALSVRRLILLSWFQQIWQRLSWEDCWHPQLFSALGGRGDPDHWFPAPKILYPSLPDHYIVQLTNVIYSTVNSK